MCYHGYTCIYSLHNKYQLSVPDIVFTAGQMV